MELSLPARENSDFCNDFFFLIKIHSKKNEKNVTDVIHNVSTQKKTGFYCKIVCSRINWCRKSQQHFFIFGNA